jgi:hypothetical protein
MVLSCVADVLPLRLHFYLIEEARPNINTFMQKKDHMSVNYLLLIRFWLAL